MIQQWFNWRTALALVAIAIVTGTVFYSNMLAEKIKTEERQKVEVWVKSLQVKMAAQESEALGLANLITTNNTDIPIIETNEKDSASGEVLNLDSVELKTNGKNYINEKLAEFKQLNKPVELVLSQEPLMINRYYYGETALLKQVRWFPLIQLLIVGMFILITITLLRTNFKSTQNQVWAGMAKETAHQMGTPLNSLQGWVEMLKDNAQNLPLVVEMEHDMERLKLVSDRFSKIGSIPQLEEKNVVVQVQHMMDYMKKRASNKVLFDMQTSDNEIPAMMSAPLFDWVLENLLKNGLDAMDGVGKINVQISDNATNVFVDISDSGKGISKATIAKVFNPGFTTKKRGWGLGLTLCKRIMEQYHGGQLFVKNSELGKGTTFRIVLKR
jgi:signal transduction histidine kinase